MADKVITLHPQNQTDDNLYPRVLGKSVQAGTNIEIDPTANTISVAQSLVDTINGKQIKGDYVTNSALTNNYYTKANIDSLLATKQGIGNYAFKSDIPVMTSQLTNNSGYLISSDLKTSVSVSSNSDDTTSISVSVGGVSSSAKTSTLKVGYAQNAHSIVDEQSGRELTFADINSFNSKQDTILKTGSSTKPVYFSRDGQVAEADTYAGGTKVTLNGFDKGSDSASFYAPTSNGTFGYVLTSGEGANVPPKWTDPSSISVGYANTAGHANSVGYATSAGYANALGTSSANYTKATLDDALNAKQNIIPGTGNSTTPVYFSESGKVTTASLYAGGTKVTLNGTEKSSSSASFYAPTSSGTAGFILTSGEGKGVPPTWTDPSSISVGYANTANHANSVGYATSAGSASYANALGTSSANYTKSTLDSVLNAKQSVIPKTGSSTEPVYFSSNGQVAKADTYAGGTKVTLNGNNMGGNSVSFYAPTSYGSAGSVLVCGEATNVPPKWVAPSSFSVGYANAIGFPGSSYTKEALDNALDSKQSTLVSGTNLKTVNGTSLLGSGNIAIAGNMVIGSTDIVYNNENVEDGTFYSALAVSHKAVLGVYVHYLSNDPYYDEIFQTCIYNIHADDGDPEQTAYTADFYYYGQNGLTPVPTGSTIRIVYID